MLTMKLKAIFGICLVLTVSKINAASINKDVREAAKLTYTLKDDGSYSFYTGSDPSTFCLSSAGAFLQASKTMYSTGDGSLKLTGTKDISGSDATGSFSGKIFQYAAGSSKMMAEVAIYNGGEFARFTQSFPDGLKDCNVSEPASLLSSFPSFNIGNNTSSKNLGFLASFGDMFGYASAISDVATHGELIRGGEQSGPLVLFDKQDNVIILSSFKSFMIHNMMYDTTSGIAEFGIMGGVTELPKDYQIDTLLYYSNKGINKAIEGWGQVLVTRYNKKRSYMEADLSINYLGYYTDNGAYYYYNTETNKTYTDTMLDVVSYANNQNIPYRYLQYDSWWYYKGIAGGVKNWTSRPDVFPKGITNLYQNHGYPVVAHNRYWAADTDYAKKNGGMYDFYVEQVKAIPDDTNFWNDLMHSSKKWGLITYEQDWLVNEFVDMKITHSNVSVARDWMMEMGNGAALNDLTIQYCMALPRHMMQSVEVPVVTQSRVSNDYHPGNAQWKIGITSMFAHALYVAPFKDTFWTTSVQSGSPYGMLAMEPNVVLQTAIATLSTGPVGPSDAIGKTDVELLMKCCRADGLIIKPSRPITSINDNILKFAYPDMEGIPNKEAEIYSTYSDLNLVSSENNNLLRFGLLLAADLTVTSYKVKTSSMYLDDVNPSGTNYVAYQGHPGTDTKIYNVTSTTSLSVPPCGTKDFQLWHVSPVLKTGGKEIVLLGERTKWVPVSAKRIQQIEVKNGNLLIDVIGNPGEAISMDFLIGGKVSSVKCMLNNAGFTRMSALSGHCLTS